MQKLCRGRLHKVTSGVKLLLFLGVVVYISRTHGPCDLKGGDGGGYLLCHCLKSCGSEGDCIVSIGLFRVLS
jgi:hypothetical protein